MNEKFNDAIKERIGEDWFEFILEEINSEYFVNIAKLIAQERKGYEVYPNSNDVFKAFKLTSIDSIKVVVLGEDPWCDGSAGGLAFGTNSNNQMNKKIMDVLNFYEEFGEIELNITREASFEYLALQGVLLLNRTLTVRRNKPRSHIKFGWSTFTAKLLRKLSFEYSNIVYILIGKDAHGVEQYLSTKDNLIIKIEHPKEAVFENRYWKASNCFSKCNMYLESKEKKIIKW